MKTTSSGLMIRQEPYIRYINIPLLSLAFLKRKLNSMNNGGNHQNYFRNLFPRPQKSFIVIDNQYANYKIVATTKRNYRKADIKKNLSYALS